MGGPLSRDLGHAPFQPLSALWLTFISLKARQRCRHDAGAPADLAPIIVELRAATFMVFTGDPDADRTINCEAGALVQPLCKCS